VDSDEESKHYRRPARTSRLAIQRAGYLQPIGSWAEKVAVFAGTLEIDGYGGYCVRAAKRGFVLASCWTHVRWRFQELATAGPAPIASEALRRVPEFYRTTRRAAPCHSPGQEPSDLRRSRAWLSEELELISQKTKLVA